MSKGKVIRIVSYAVFGGVLVLCTKSCVDGCIAEANFKKYYKNNNKPTTSSTDVMTNETTYNVTEAVFANNFSEYVNENIYNILLNAKNKYEILLYGNSSVSEKMTNTGLKLNANDAGYIDNGVNNIYNFICSYITSYDNKDYNTCYNAAIQLDQYSYEVSNKYLYGLLVKNNLNSNYKSDIKYDASGNPVYQFGNIALENGKQIRFLGGDTTFTENNLGDFSSRMKWMESIPTKLFDRYIEINDVNGDDVCYILNKTKTNDYYAMEIKVLLSECSSMYNVDVDNISINEINGDYYFTSNGNALGLLDSNQKTRYERIRYINDAITNGKSDGLLLDSYVTDMYSNQSNNTYNK